MFGNPKGLFCIDAKQLLSLCMFLQRGLREQEALAEAFLRRRKHNETTEIFGE